MRNARSRHRWLSLFSLDLMHRLAIALLLMSCTMASAQRWTHKEGAPPAPATEAYFGRVGTIIFNTLVPELSKHPERLGGAVRVALLIDRNGHIQVQKVVSTTSNHWVQDTALRVVRSVKLPPMPKEVITEQKQEPVHFEAEWSFERHDKSALHFDGLYCCTRESDIGPATFYLRFYPDGVVLSVASTGSPTDVAQWLTRSKQKSFHYSTTGTSLRLEDENGEMTFRYSGMIYPEYIAMRVDGFDTATKAYRGTVERTYQFTPVAMQP
jgi:TonB family protein